MNFNEFLSPEDLKRIDEIELILELNEDNSLLFLIGVDDKELGEVFKNYFQEKLKNTIFYNKFEPRRIFTNLLEKDSKPYYLIDLYSKRFKDENQKEIALDFLFNRDYIPERGLKLIVIVENRFLDFLMRKASDFISFNNFLHHFKSYKLHLKESYSTPKLDKAIAEFKEFRKNNSNAETTIILDKMINISNIAINYGELEIAIKYLNEAYKRTKKDKFYEGIILGSLGNIYIKTKNLDKALNLYQKTLHIFSKFNNETNLANTLLNIGNIYLLKNDLNRAKNFYSEVMELAEELNNKLFIAEAISGIGKIHFFENNLEKALDYQKKALNIFKKFNYTTSISQIYILIGEIYQKKNNLEKAIYYHIKALKLREELENKHLILINLVKIAYLYSEQNITHLAKTYYEKALTLAKQQNYSNLIKEIEEKLQELK